MPRETFCVYGRGGHDQLEIRTPRQQTLHVAEQEIDVEAALVRFVDDDGVVGREQRIALRFGEQYAVGHHLDVTLGRHLVRKTYLVADRMPERALEFRGDARGDRARRDAARLRMSYHAGDAAFEFEADLGQLRGLARAGLAAHDHHLVRIDCARDFGAFGDNRQFFGVGRARQVREAPRR